MLLSNSGRLVGKSTATRLGLPLRLIQPGSRARPCVGAVLAAYTAIAVASAPGQLAAQTDDAAGTRPNILVVVSDDIGWGQPGFNGGTEVGTPNLDRIAYEGVKLTQFYVAPGCSPTRYSLMSGRYHWKTGNKDELPTGNTTIGMLLDERTIAEALRDTGYSTWMVGKWHLGQWHQAHLPLQRGFDHHYGLYSGTFGYYSHHRAGILDLHRNGRPVVEEGYSTFLMAEEAIQLIERHDGRRPFFLYLAFNAAHLPAAGVPDEYADRYAHLRSSLRRSQRGQLKAMDDALGWVIDALDRKGALDDTLVVYFNDNGGTDRAGGNRPYRGLKGDYLEGGIRVPAAMRWPGRIPAASETDALLHVVDLFPTLAGVAGASTSGGLPLDGIDAWQAIAAGSPSPRDEVVHSLKVIRSGDWKLITRNGKAYGGGGRSVQQLYNIGTDPYEETNLASSEEAKVAELRERLDYHRQFARDSATATRIRGSPAVYGEAENAAYAAEVRTAMSQRNAGNLGPVLLRLEVSGTTAKLVFNETLNADSVPPASAFRAVVLPGYRAVAVNEVGVYGSDVLLALSQAVGIGETLGLTYEVPDAGAVRDPDSLAADGVTWVTAESDGAFAQSPLTATFEAAPWSHDGSSPLTLRLRFSEAVSTSDITLRDLAIGVTGGRVSEAQRVAGQSWLWDLTLLPSGPVEITVTFPATESCSDTGAICTTAGKALSNSPQLTIPAVRPVVSIAAPSTTVTEGAQAAFELTVDRVAAVARTLPVHVTETGSMLAGTPPTSVTFAPGDTSATLLVATAGDLVAEADSTVTASLAAGTGYAVGTATSASVTVADDDRAVFTVTATPTTVKEGQTATLTVAVSNGVTFADAQTISLATSGSASASDYTGVPPTLTLAAGASSAMAELTASADQEEEPDETVTVEALHGGVSIGSATVTIGSVSHEAALTALSLSGVDIGTFSGATTAYTASVGHDTRSTTVTATASHAKASVSVSSGGELSAGPEVSLEEGVNEITVTVTAEDGTTTRTYTVTVVRAALPVATIAAGTTPVTEGEAATFTVTLDPEAPEALTVAVDVAESGSALSGTPPATVTFAKGETSATLSVPTVADSIVQATSTVTASLVAGAGYVLGATTSASITVEDVSERAGTVPRPNIVVFLADDMGWGQPGFNGGTEVATPHMDRIADEGVRLAQFYAQPVGAASRGSLFTGRHAWKTGLSRNPDSGRDGGLPLDERTMAEALRDAGYATWLVGKWQLGHWGWDRLPLQRGFEHHYGFYNEFIDSYGHFRLWQGSDKILDWHRNGRPVVESGYATELLAEEASQLIARHDGSHPFFLLVAFNAPHDPYQAPETYTQQFGHLQLSEEQRKQRAMVKALDDAIGKVVGALDSREVLDETLVMFLNDNGGPSEAGGNGPYRGQKGYYLEGGIRVPAALRWPGRITAGSVSDALLHVVDLFPTFAGLSGADLGGGLALDGVDAWEAIAEGAASPRDEIAFSPKVIRAGDWKLIEKDGISLLKGVKSSVQLYNLAEDPYETTNLASSEKERAAEFWERLVVQHPSLRIARAGEAIPGLGSQGSPPVVFGAAENAAYGAEAARALAELDAGNPGPTLVRLEAAGDRVKLVYDEALDTGSVPAADAFTLVVKSGYRGVGVTDVAVSGTDVLLTLGQSPAFGETVGLTYEVPDSGAIRDVDRLDAVGVTWVTAPVSAAFSGQDATLSALSLSGIDIGTFSAATTDYGVVVPNATSSTTVTATANAVGARVSVSPGATVSLAEGANEITVTVTAADGTTVQTYRVTVTRAVLPVVSIAAVPSPVKEGEAAEFEVTLSEATAQALAVAVHVTESGAMLAGAPPGSVTVPPGTTSAALSVATAGDLVVELASTVTASVAAGTGYTVGAAASASVTVEDDDLAAFTVTTTPTNVKEGETAKLTVAVSNGVTFAEDQSVDLAVSGTASLSDHAEVPAALTLMAGASSATAKLIAKHDREEEPDETLTVTASLGGDPIGAATLTIESVSHDATLSELSLSGIDIGTFASGTTAYTASVPNATTSTTVAAAANQPEANVSISPGAAVSLAEGANDIAVTVTAEDGTTTTTYTVTVIRATLPKVTIAAGASPLTEGSAALFTVTLDPPATEALTVAVEVIESGSALSGTPPASVAFGVGDSTAPLSVPTAADSVVEPVSTVTATVTAGTGYTIGAASAASATVEDDDAATFTVVAEPGAIDEGETSTLTVAISNGVTFAEAQPISLAASGTASASDYTGVPPTLTLPAGESSVTSALAAAADQEEEQAETVTVTASHEGSAIGSATVIIHSISHDATLAALSLAGIDIGTFSAETTAYAASVANSVETTTVTATASHSGASVEIAPGSEVRLAEGENTVTVTVTAGDGETTRTYTVTVTRASLPVVSVAAVASRVSEGEPAKFLISLTEPAAESLRVGIRWERSDQSQAITQHTVFRTGMSSKAPSFSKSDDKVVREDLTVTLALEDGEGYRVSEDARSAQVVLEENDAAEFAVSVDPASVPEGGTAKLQVRTTNGVTFAADQTIALSFAGSTATKGADYTVSAESLTLRAGRRRVAASLTAVADSEQEEDETVKVQAAHGGEVIGTATLTITASEPAPEGAGEGFSLAPQNASPSGIWSDGETAWVADLADARLYAYRREDGERQPQKDIATERSPMGMWSDGQTLWVAQFGGGLRAHRLSDGARLPGRDLALEANAAPGGVWSDGETVWVSEWLGDTVQAYRLSSGRREAGRDIWLADGNLMPVGLWSDGETLWVADWQERVYAYRLSDGSRDFRRDVEAGTYDTDPTGLWSGDGTLLATGWESGEVRAYRLAEGAAEAPGRKPGTGPTAPAVSLPTIADPALRATIGAALNKAPGETVSPRDLAGLEELAARNAGIRDLSGLERAVSLKALDLGFNPLADLRPLAALRALESLNLDGAATDLQALASLPRLRRLSLRNNGLEDLWPLAGLTSLTELSLGGNRIADLRPLAGLGRLAVLRLDRNRIADLWPLASLAGLEALDLAANRARNLQPLAGLARLRSLALGGNGLSELHALSGLKGLADLGLAGNAVDDLRALSDLTGLRRLDLRGNAVGDLRPLRGLPLLVWVHVGGSGIEDLAPLDGLDGLAVTGRDDLEPPSGGSSRVQRPGSFELDPGSR